MHEMVGTGNIINWLKIDSDLLKVTIKGTDRFGC